MPQVLKTADQLAFECAKTILMVDFMVKKKDCTKHRLVDYFGTFEWDTKAQERFIGWLEKELPNVKWERVFPPLSKGIIIIPYMGHIALIVSEKDQPEEYAKVVNYWENPDGTPKFDDTRLYFVPPDMYSPPVEGEENDW